MNIQATNRLTPAETALVDTYTAKFSELPGDGAVVAARDVLFDDLKTGGLPTRRIEAWHYTDLRRLLVTPDETPCRRAAAGRHRRPRRLAGCARAAE